MIKAGGVFMLEALRNPNLYHGENKKGCFFEGWYFKIVHPKKECTYCFIPGIFLSSREEYSHSFIQIVNGNGVKFKYLRFRKDEFEAEKGKFNVHIGKNLFSLKELNLDIDKDGEKIFGKLVFKNIKIWPDSFINPGSMGFYNYLGFMQCYSQVCAIDGDIEGSLAINGKNMDFTGGKLYIEKNWGKDFPYSYIWLQGNGFTSKEAAFTCSIGHIPFLRSSFTGFLIGIYVKESFYKFTTINRSSISINFGKESFILETHSKKASLQIEAEYSEESFMDLYAPHKEYMIPLARESLQGKLKVTLYDKKRDYPVLMDNCSCAGVEFSGNYKNLCKRIGKRI